ncbi:sugar nucleotide-binding protein [Zunongwangia atlantica]|uniref:dTDP-4-dehydrorhamnose reductase n=1 Tax=Zunongwangia atlantica 22II14-10F7 TaxID=1185767 RepID=A0A1Y1T692_9FLAO|nr:sugar nucleotide-binding protein [Zunongwangia atlantica]ORL46569.1 dTDP-4-dehydrorhamnose reductase-like protein [Zunongwangia atlantica 22II14-10F7]
MERILVLGASGFIGNAIYKELCSYFDTHGTYCTDNPGLEKNHKFHQYDMETDSLDLLLYNLRPSIIISAVRGSFEAQIALHYSAISYILTNPCKLIFLSSANVFDAFTNYPSYEYDKTLSQSIYGRFKIKIENALLRLPNDKYNILRLPMVFGQGSPRLNEIKSLIDLGEAIEVFPNVVINVTEISKITQQIHYIVNRKLQGVFHLGSSDLVHQKDFVEDVCEILGYENPLFKNVYDSNNDRYLAVLPKDNLLPLNLQISVQEVVEASIKKIG